VSTGVEEEEGDGDEVQADQRMVQDWRK